MKDAIEPSIIVDAHVHIYDCFDVDVLLEAAATNFRHAAHNAGLSKRYTGVLLLSETIRDNWFQQTREKCRQNSQPLVLGNNSNWQLQETHDKVVLKATRFSNDKAKESIYIMAGRQIITSEGLELLALATDSAFDDRLPLSSLLEIVREQDAIPVLPWAVGKWLGKRGKLLSALLQDAARDDFFLGDNSGRPVFWTNPLHFKQAREKNMQLLPGTDPLPFVSEASRVGSFGFMMKAELTNAQPSTDLKRYLRDKSAQLRPYGQLETPLRFIVNQIRLRVA